jgi:LysR family transcriptional regulator, carnitine catabolism transcriptional activator
MNITLLQLRAFLALADALSFTAAAERLHIRQSTLSSTIRNLESSLGGRLFDRDTRRVQLTALGLACRRLAIRLLDEAERTEEELARHVRGETGRLRIAALPNIFPTLLAPALANFRQGNPGVALQFVDVTSDDAVQQLRNGQADIAVAVQLADDADLRYQLLDIQRFVALLPASHVLAAQPSIAWSDLVAQELIVVQSRDAVGARIASALRQAGLTPQLDHRVNELPTAVGLLQAGFGIALMGHHTAEHALRPGLVMRELHEPAIDGRVCIITMANNELSPSLKRLQEVLLRHAPARLRPADLSLPSID